MAIESLSSVKIHINFYERDGDKWNEFKILNFLLMIPIAEFLNLFLMWPIYFADWPYSKIEP